MRSSPACYSFVHLVGTLHSSVVVGWVEFFTRPNIATDREGVGSPPDQVGGRPNLGPFHSRTSSARATNASGNEMPSAAAVLRLTAMWKRDDCSMRMSAGLAPRAIRWT